MFNIQTADQYFAQTDLVVDWDRDHLDNSVTYHEGDAIQEILCLKVALSLMKDNQLVDRKVVYNISSKLEVLIEDYEDKYRKKFIPEYV